MDPLSALLLSMLIAGYFVRNVTQDLVFKARGEDPPSYRRQQERAARRAGREPVTGRQEARKFFANAWGDAWESAHERRQRGHEKRAERRNEKWDAEDAADRARKAAAEANRNRDRSAAQQLRPCGVCWRGTPLA